MNWNHWTAFRVVAEHGGFSHAAQVVHLSQPALSAQVAELEANLGVRLFDRLPRGVSLTDAGELLLDYTRRMSALEQDALYALEELQGLRQGKLTVGASQTIGVYLLPALLGRFQRRYPGIELHAKIANSAQIQTLLLDGTLDLALTEGRLPERESLKTEIFSHDRLVAIAPCDHSLGLEPLTLTNFLNQRLILREEGSGTRAVWEAELERRGLEMRYSAMSLGNTEAIKRAVQAGLGFAVVSHLAVEVEVAARSLCILPLKGVKLTRPLYRTTRRDRTLPQTLSAFLEIVTDHTEKRA